jgi:hypothetical protein
MRNILIIILIFLLLTGCKRSSEISKEEYEILYKEKGIKMGESLKPMILECKYKFNGIKEFGDNTLVTVNDHKEWSTLEIDNNGYIEMKTLIHGFPNDDLSVGITIPEHKIVISWIMRYAYIYDGEMKQTREVGASSESNAEITDISLIDSNKKIYLIDLVDHAKDIGTPGSFYIIYDFINDKKILKSEYYDGMLYKMNNNKILFLTSNGIKNKFYITDSLLKIKEENKLTKELTKFQIFFNSNDCISFNNRIGLGTAWIGNKDKLIYYSIRWDEKYEDVKVEPIIIQKPFDQDVSSKFELSQDGKWVKTTVDNVPGPVDVPMLVFYSVSDIYPQGLSMPILAGYASDGGCFMNHKVWGPCYVDYNIDHPNKLFVFKLTEGLELLAKQTVGQIGGK